MTQPLHRLTLIEAATAMAAGEFSTEQYVRELLDRIAATDANVQAWVHLDPEHALALARDADARREAGIDAAPLGGVPVGVKDVVATADQPTQLGSPIYAGACPPFDAECVSRLKRAGGIVLGKTVTTEFAFMQPAKTRNPWNAAHTPGGSSSGSAAAVALGQVPVAIGTQTNGSVIRPAAYCGIVGFKPSKDALPFSGVNLFSPTVDTLGLLARTVSDCAVLANCLADAGTLPAALGDPERPPRIGFLSEFPWVAASSVQSAAIEAAIDAFRSSAAMVTEVSLPESCRDANTVHRRITLREGVGQLGALQERERSRMSAKLNAALDEGRAVTASEYAFAMERRAEIIAELIHWMAPFDAIVSAPAPGPAPEDLTQTGDPGCCTLWSLAGFPALTLPIALAPNGMPLGLQLAARHGEDKRALASARWCETRLPFKGLI